jgi:hypothetical protein
MALTGNGALGLLFGASGVDIFMGIPRCRERSRLEVQIALIGADACTPSLSVGFHRAGGPAATRAAVAAQLQAAVMDMLARQGGRLSLPECAQPKLLILLRQKEPPRVAGSAPRR